MSTPHLSTPVGFADIARLDRGERIAGAPIHELLEYIDARHDCADFRLVPVLRSLYCYAHLLPEATVEAMQQTVLGFKYWMDEPGEDSMCYWSENHQLLFAVCEYLAGQLYPTAVFRNDGQTGAEHQAKAAVRLEIWLASRFRWGFVEWHSNVYYEEDVAALSLLIDCAADPELRRKATILLDLLLLDMALHSYRGLLAAASGRCYAEQKQDPQRQNVRDVMAYAFGYRWDEGPDYGRVSADLLLNKRYRVPELLKQIALDPRPRVVQDSQGLDLGEVRRYFPDTKDKLGHGMYLWSMEAFSNPESARQTVQIWRDWELQSNGFLSSIRYMDIPLLRRTPLLPLLLRVLNPVTQGLAIQRANTYSYRTADYLLSTAQRYHPGTFGDQQHIWQATVGRGVSVFTTHPGAPLDTAGVRNTTPNYWVGNGIQPHAQQDEHVVLVRYDLSARRGFLEQERQGFTHAWFPAAAFDEVVRVSGQAICARSVGGYVALLASQPWEERLEANELVLAGVQTGWAAVLGSEQEGSFAAFVEGIRSASLVLEGERLVLSQGGKRYVLTYKKGLTVDGEPREDQHLRLASPYGQVARDAEVYAVRLGEEALSWRF